VLMGEVDAAGVRDIVAEEFVPRGLRILDRSQPIPNFPFVVAPKVPSEVVREIVRVLVAVPAEDASARATIASWDEELAGGFAPANAADFDPLMRVGEQLFGPRWTELPEKALECSGGER
jgi:ABC-type phosphate/phosphonate transport system substrate-binding protein